MFGQDAAESTSSSHYGTLKNVPNDVRRSLELLDDIIDQCAQDIEDYPKVANRALEATPSDVRHSLEFLDDILGEFDAEENKLSRRGRVHSKISLRNVNAVSEDVRNSLNKLDNILVEFEQDDSNGNCLRNAGQTLNRRNRHEDIRRSLEVLDSVLAEFDDCLESWDSPPAAPDFKLSESIPTLRKKFERDDCNSNGNIPNGHSTSRCKLSNQTSSTDGTTSHSPSSFVLEQPKVSSPPPIPKRSPTTKLSEKNFKQFSFPSDDTSLDSYSSAGCEFTSQDDNSLSDSLVPQQQISALSPKYNGDIQRCDTPPKSNTTYSSDKCSNCGRGLKRISPAMESTESENAPSPFMQRKQVFEAKIAQASANASPVISRSHQGSSIRFKKMVTDSMDTTSEPSSLSVNLSSENVFNSESVTSNGLLTTIVTATSPVSPCPIGNCTCKERIRKLGEKFSETRQLLKLKRIKGLDQEPPTFVPMPPPTEDPTHSKTHRKIELPSKSDSSDASLTAVVPNTSGNDVSEIDVTNASDDQSFYSADVSDNCVSSLKSEKCPSSLDSPSKLCDRCSSSLSGYFGETIEDLPKLLPTDALNRPYLGFSYSLEDDLSPGVKEIRQTSTPKSGVSPPSLFRTKEDSNLSTFSHSVSSLGYVSSQSDLELNNISTAPDKVPVSSFKSMTLPNGLDRSPFYSPADEVHSALDKMYSERGHCHDHNDNRLLGVRKSGHLSTEELRSSIVVPPSPEAEKPKKRHFRAFSRKDKKDKKKNGVTP